MTGLLEVAGSDIYIGLMADLGKRIRYQLVAVVEPTSSVPPQLAGILDGPPEDTIKVYKLPGAGSFL